MGGLSQILQEGPMEPQGIYKGKRGAEIGGMHLLPARGHEAKESGQPAQEGIPN